MTYSSGYIQRDDVVMPGTTHAYSSETSETSEPESIAPCLHINSCWLAESANELD